MIGRADIEGSKSDVAMNAWPPQASYPCGNFSDTSSLIYPEPPKQTKGSIGHAFAVFPLTERQDQANFCPFTLRQISVLSESTLGHPRYVLMDVPPQSNSQPDAVLGHSRPRITSFKVTPTLTARRAYSENKPLLSPSKQRSDTGRGVSLSPLSSPLHYTQYASSQNQTRVKLNRVFFPR